MKLVFASAARAALDQIGDWIAADNPERAVSFIAEIRARCTTLARIPRAFPLVPHHETSGIRRCPFRDYLIFYRVADDTITVIHVVHGARNYEPLLFPTGDEDT